MASWLSAQVVATWIGWGGAVAVGDTDFSVAESERLQVFDGHDSWPSPRLKRRFELVDDILFDRWAPTANDEDLELVERLRETWDDGLGALLELIASLRQ